MKTKYYLFILILVISCDEIPTNYEGKNHSLQESQIKVSQPVSQRVKDSLDTVNVLIRKSLDEKLNAIPKYNPTDTFKLSKLEESLRNNEMFIMHERIAINKYKKSNTLEDLNYLKKAEKNITTCELKIDSLKIEIAKLKAHK